MRILDPATFVIAWPMKTLADAWTTRTCLHAGEQWSCIYGCNCKDRLQHNLQSPVALSALASALGQQLPIPVPSIFDLIPISQPWIRLDSLKLFCLPLLFFQNIKTLFRSARLQATRLYSGLWLLLVAWPRISVFVWL